MANDTDNATHHDEDTLRKVYEALLKNGIFGQKATDVVSDILNAGVLFRERTTVKRGRPRGATKEIREAYHKKIEELETAGVSELPTLKQFMADYKPEDAWAPTEDSTT